MRWALRAAVGAFALTAVAAAGGPASNGGGGTMTTENRTRDLPDAPPIDRAVPDTVHTATFAFG
jgi:hypothetical protein